MFKTRFISMLVLLMTAVTGAWAQPWTSGDCTVTLTDDGVLIVSGTGAMADYTKVTEQPWASYRSSITSIVVGEGVTHIGNFALMGCNKATSVSLSSSLTSIGTSAFRACNNAGFTSIAIPANVETIGDNAFHSCNKLTQVNIPDKVTSIGQNAFYGCTAVTSITVGKSVTSIGEMAFQNCSAMTTLAVKAPACALGTNALDACSSLTTIYVTTDKADYYKTADGWSAYAAKIQAGYDISLKEGTEDAYKWAIMPGLAAEGDAVTLQYNGRLKVKSVKAKKAAAAAAKTLAEATLEDIGKIAGKDGKIYATKAAAEAVATGNAVAMIAYVGTASDCTHGLAIALADESGTKDYGAAGTACSGKAAVTGGTWRLPSEKDWQYMFIGCGSSESYSAPTPDMSKSYSGLASKLTTAQGDALQSSDYWSSTEYSPGSYAWRVAFVGSLANFYLGYENVKCRVRACLAF